MLEVSLTYDLSRTCHALGSFFFFIISINKKGNCVCNVRVNWKIAFVFCGCEHVHGMSPKTG